MPTFTTVHAETARLLAAGKIVGIVGGDHSVPYGALTAIAAKHPSFGVLHFDAHSDTWPDDGTRNDHGTMFVRAAGSGIIDMSRSIHVGIRSHNPDGHGIAVLTAAAVHRMGVDATIAAIRERVGTATAYLTFDIDVLDPAFAPGTGTPVAGGLASWQALEILRGLSGLKIVGADVVEVSPPYDYLLIQPFFITIPRIQVQC